MHGPSGFSKNLLTCSAASSCSTAFFRAFYLRGCESLPLGTEGQTSSSSVKYKYKVSVVSGVQARLGTVCSSVASSHVTSLHTTDGDNPRMDEDPSSCSLCCDSNQTISVGLDCGFVKRYCIRTGIHQSSIPFVRLQPSLCSVLVDLFLQSSYQSY